MSREELEKRILEARYNLVSSKDKETIDILEELAIEALTEKKGKWIKNAEEWDSVNPPYICSECGNAEIIKRNFCSNCGARMER